MSKSLVQFCVVQRRETSLERLIGGLGVNKSWKANDEGFRGYSFFYHSSPGTCALPLYGTPLESTTALINNPPAKSLVISTFTA